MRHWIILIVVISFFAQSCEKEILNPDTYIEYRFSNNVGSLCNGDFNIEPDDDFLFKEVTAVLLPATQADPETVILQFTDYTDGRQVFFAIPVQPGEYLINKNSFYEVSIVHPTHDCVFNAKVEGTSLISMGLTLNVLEFRRGTGGFLGIPTVEYLAVDFSGTMNHLHDMFDHRVEGYFVYNADDVH